MAGKYLIDTNIVIRKNMLRKIDRPIPDNDIWIGSIAKQHKLTLATGDMHFKEIEGIKLAEF